MPIYKCPKCGRVVARLVPDVYYCRFCGEDVIMEQIGLKIEEERAEGLEDVKSRLMSASDEEVADADKYWSLAKRLKELGFRRQAEKVESIAKDEERHNIIISNILKEIK